ncbi:hypothetical protein OOJ09_27560 [Mesorhizobium qingshengii]|uniref:DUF4426 domain-containing protein n=1 Tax=Mesorhizobium qingshengii TaxID=1165689 RepID=A0ABT4R2A6_9HYPH|nr:hypothetical protein [Mesorhizobium qingshengii]MCZ8547952.1 hypothetical protein [Mesorhizobium qingshengii]
MFYTRRNTIATVSPDGICEAPIAAWPDLRRGLFAVLATALWLTAIWFTPALAEENENYKVAQGLGVYLGVLPAAIVRGHLESHPEATMHGGAPRGAHEYHMIVAVFEAATGARIENAKVTATVSGLGHVGQNSLELEPMAIAGTVTYGGFVALPGSDRYDIQVDISVPGRPAPARVKFTYGH